MTITADARSSAPTAAGPPTSSQSTTDASQATSVSPYGIVPDASTTPDSASPDEPPRGDGQGRRSDDAGPPHAPGFTAKGPKFSVRFPFSDERNISIRFLYLLYFPIILFDVLLSLEFISFCFSLSRWRIRFAYAHSGSRCRSVFRSDIRRYAGRNG